MSPLAVDAAVAVLIAVLDALDDELSMCYVCCIRRNEYVSIGRCSNEPCRRCVFWRISI